VALKVALLAGLAAGVTVAGSVVLGLLGAVSLVSIGYAGYYKFVTKKPQVADVI
jgi:hypothetical protein